MIPPNPMATKASQCILVTEFLNDQPRRNQKCKTEPRYAGAFPFVTTIKTSVPTPFIRSTIAGLIPNRNGTSTDAPNMANIC